MHTRVGVLLVILAFAPWRAASAQAPVRDSVVATVEQVFAAMRARDTTNLRARFDTTARLMRVPESAAAPTRPQTVSQFLTSVSTAAPDRAFDERMYDPDVRIEGPIAQLWTYYTFREGRTFSHCGVDAITLMRAGGEWRIVSWIWTARRTGCTRTE